MNTSSEYFQVVALSRNEHDNKLWQIHHTTLTIAYNKFDKLCADFNFCFGNSTTGTENVRLTRHDNDWSDLEQIGNFSLRTFSLCRAISLSSSGPMSLVRLQYKKWYEGSEEKERELAHTSYLSRTPRIYSCKFFLAGVNFYRFNAKIGNLLCILP